MTKSYYAFFNIAAAIILALALTGCNQNNFAVDGNSREALQSEVAALLASYGADCSQVVDTAGVMDASATSESRSINMECPELVLVKLKGVAQRFGLDLTVNPPAPIPYGEVLPGMGVWVAEYPVSKYLKLTTDSSGLWTIWVLKMKGVELKLSFIYEKEGWITTKSNVIIIADEDILDLSMQCIDPIYFTYGVKPGIEAMLSQAAGQPVSFVNGITVTVGKAWASLYDMRLPHGDPGAYATINGQFQLPGVIGPVYFNEMAVPDPAYSSTSVDGGVSFINAPLGVYSLSAYKPPFAYDTVVFDITQADRDNNVVLYIASPPHSIQGTNTSGPGEN